MLASPATIDWRGPGLMLVAISLLAMIAMPVRALAQSDRPRPIVIRVDSVLAANTGKGMDAQLASTPIGSRLRTLFEYTTYRLVMHQEQRTRCGRMITFEMPGGRILHIAPSSVLDNMISMEIVLFEGTRPSMTTDLKLMNHSVLVVGGPHYEQGMLITMISTDVPDRPGERTVEPTPAAVPPQTSGALPAESPDASPPAPQQ